MPKEIRCFLKIKMEGNKRDPNFVGKKARFLKFEKVTSYKSQFTYYILRVRTEMIKYRYIWHSLMTKYIMIALKT